MKKKSLWLIVLLVIMCLSLSLAIVGCASNDKYITTSVLQIANKAELQADWFEDGENREIKLTLPPEVTADDVYVTSSNPAVVLVEGKTLKASGVGIAKIVVRANDETDSVNITVKQSLKEIFITNKRELRNIVVGEERMVGYSIKPDAVDVDKLNVEITSSNTGVVSVNDKKLKAVSLGTSTVTVKAGNYSDALEINVINLAAPTFGVEDGAIVDGVTKSEIKLPVSALSCDGIDLRERVEATCSEGLTFDKDTMSVLAENKGEYTIKLETSDPRNSSMVASVNLTIKVYRKIFADYNGYGNIGYESYEEGKQFIADENQVTTFDRWDATFASFDMQPSQIYYAELVIDSESKADWSTFYGMTHSVKGDATRWLTAYMDRGAAVTREPEEGEEDRYYKGARDFRIKDIDILNDPDCWQLHQGNNPRTQILYSYGLNRLRGLDKMQSFPCKLATARIGDFFYFFVNDDYVCALTNKYLQGKDTVPGFFQQSGIKTDIKNIVWLNGSSAQAKFNALTDNGSKVFSEFAPSEWWKNENEASEHITHSNEAEGANFTFNTDTLMGENKGIVTPYIFFDGDFTFEWEYKFEESSTAGNWDRFMGLEVRHLRDENSAWASNYSNKYAFLFGGMRQNGSDGNDICAMVKCFSKDKPNDWDWERPMMLEGGKEWYSNNKSLRYRVTRICTETMDGKPVAKYTFTIDRADGTEQTVWKYDDYGLDKWNSPCEPVILLWKNKGVKGTYSNVKWSIPQDGVEISNKAALTQKWTVGDADRMVATTINGSLEGPATVTSSNQSVISVNGNVISAVGRGMATITVKIGDYTDTVEINVTPALEGVTIANKDELTAEWKDNSTAGRKVAVAYAPADVYNTSNTPFTVKSSDNGVIAVDGTTLKVTGAGRATITVTAGGKSDSVEITVKSTQPSLKLKDNVTEIYGVAENEIILPEFTALSADNEDISEQVVIACDSDNFAFSEDKTTITVTESGEYTVTYTLDSIVIELKVYAQRNVLTNAINENGTAAIEYETGEEYMRAGNEIAYLNGNGISFAQMNVTAGKTYYAEATFLAGATIDGNVLFGITFSEKNSTSRFLAVYTDRGDKTNENYRGVKVKDINTTTAGWTNLSADYASPNIFTIRELGAEKNADRVKVAVARLDNFYYVFIDDVYVLGFTDKDYTDKDLVPGIFQKSSSKTGITNIAWFTATEATDKFNFLTQNGSKVMTEYNPNSWWTGVNQANQYMTYSEDTSKGVNFTFTDASKGENEGIVTPYIFLDGDFSFEWEYTFAEGVSAQDWTSGMKVEVRSAAYSDWGVKFGVTNVQNGENNLCLGANIAQNTDLGGNWYNGYSGKYKFKITRICNGDSATFNFYAYKDGMEIYNKNWSGTTTDNLGSTTAPVILILKNGKVAGEYTNIKWSATAENN